MGTKTSVGASPMRKVIVCKGALETSLCFKRARSVTVSGQGQPYHRTEENGSPGNDAGRGQAVARRCHRTKHHLPGSLPSAWMS